VVQPTTITADFPKLKTRLCTGCNTGILEARLRAVPNATQCVSCLNAAGDVPLLRRFDGVYFTENRSIEQEILRQSHMVSKLSDNDPVYSTETHSIKAVSLPRAIEEQGEILAREWSTKMRVRGAK
jgi:Prokaryotic dksA/traR C4-type zinc finger